MIGKITDSPPSHPCSNSVGIAAAEQLELLVEKVLVIWLQLAATAAEGLLVVESAVNMLGNPRLGKLVAGMPAETSLFVWLAVGKEQGIWHQEDAAVEMIKMVT